jgi:hypothetical protein
MEVEETVNVTTALGLGMNGTTALADVVLGSGVRLQVRVTGEQGAMVRALGSDGIGIYSPTRDGSDASNVTSTSGRIRAGLSMVFLFSKERPVSFKRLVLGAWDATDQAQLVVTNNEFAADVTIAEASTTAATTTADASSTEAASTAAPTAAPGPGRKRQLAEQDGAVVLINEAESSFDEETAAGFTRYELTAMGESDFTVKSFMFTMRVPGTPASTAGADATTEAVRAIGEPSSPSGFVFDTMTIALIAAGGALCLICLVVLIVCLARRKKNGGGRKDPEPVTDNFTVQMDEMRPALVDPSSSLARTLPRNDSLPSINLSMSSDNYHVLAAAMPNSAPSVGGSSMYKQLALPDSYQPLPSSPQQPIVRPYSVVPSSGASDAGGGGSEYQSVPQFATSSKLGASPPPYVTLGAPPAPPGAINSSPPPFATLGAPPSPPNGLGAPPTPPSYATIGLSRSVSTASIGGGGGLPPPPPVRTTSTQELSRQYNNIPI